MKRGFERKGYCKHRSEILLVLIAGFAIVWFQSATATEVYTINVTPTTTLLSFVTKISPSPDWFLGVSSFNLIGTDNILIESASIALFAIDAGTDAGETYTSDNSPENKSIVLRTGLPLSSDPNETGKSLGNLVIERID